MAVLGQFNKFFLQQMKQNSLGVIVRSPAKRAIYDAKLKLSCKEFENLDWTNVINKILRRPGHIFVHQIIISERCPIAKK